MYKRITKQKNDSWDDISRRAFGTPEHSGDFEKLNNGTLGDEVIIFEEPLNSDDDSQDGEIILQVGENEFIDFSEYKLISSLDSARAGIFIFLPSSINNKLMKGQPAKIIDESGTFLEGRIANIKAVLREDINFVQVEVKSNAGILVETNVPYPLEFGNQSIKECLTTLVGYYGQTIEFDDGGICDEIFTNEIGTSYAARPNETIFQFIYRILASRGLTLIDAGCSLKVIKLNPENPEKINFIEGECIGVKLIRADFIGDNLARYYEVNSGYPENASAVITTPITTPVTKRLESDDINAKDIQSSAERIVCKELGKHYNIYIELADNFSVAEGEIAIIKYPSILINNETDFVIKKVVRTKPDILQLFLTLPCVYTGIMPETLPLTY